MTQEQMSVQEAQDATLIGGNSGGFNTTTGYTTGTACPFSGTFRASNKYMDIVVLYAQGELLLPGPDGKKTTWYALTRSLATNKSGDFTSVKVDPGTV